MFQHIATRLRVHLHGDGFVVSGPGSTLELFLEEVRKVHGVTHRGTVGHELVGLKGIAGLGRVVTWVVRFWE